MPDAAQMIATVEAYVAAFEAGDAEAIVALFAPDCTVEDPVGAPLREGFDAVRAFYVQAVATGAKLVVDGPVRLAGDCAAFPLSVYLTFASGPGRIDVIDIFRFDADGKVLEMRAFWGPTNVQGL